MNDIRNILKNNLIAYSKDRKITQKELSELLGVTQSAVSHWFKGDNSPNIEVVAKIAEILDVPISALLSESERYDKKLDTLMKNNSPSAYEFEPGEEQAEADPMRSTLLHNFEQLNQEGQERLVETSDDMVSSGKYIKTSANHLGNKKYA